ncbi:winged helix-turn-helix domain-containing protein [Nocardiopsis exhalans]|uniref:Winged helix-turn-helix domain-containing protein n=1 Tax=Nocardiopsis exhalans TaxID=163604 RepID=A0ABY5D0G5_9ACTN|nr:BTAD domain-containing putative transcriptional regulator [Nocardiopsis exhalans]USY17699.1 winged helix-turn-helix domain-containing protein [Nocardiopsis exhalans]
MTVLGELAVFGEDRAIDLGAPRQRSVLAALALHANRSLSTQRIVATVWNTGEPTYASNLVHKYVSGLRRALAELEPHRRISIDNDRGGYRLTVRADQLDFTLFHAQVEAAEDLRDQGEHARAADLYARALRLWRGPFLGDLPGLAFDDERTHLEGVRLTVLQDYARVALTAGRYAEAVGPLSDALRLHPLEENLARFLMLAQYRLGNPAKAVQVYERLEHRTAQELNMPPQPALKELANAIRSHARLPEELTHQTTLGALHR